MASTERTYDRAQIRATRTVATVGAEFRTARLAAGRSQRDIAKAARISQSQLGRIELGRNRSVSIAAATTIAAAVGLDLVVNFYPGPRVVRDAPQLGLLHCFRDLLGDEWEWRYEVRVAAGDQRAWDAWARHRISGVEIFVEAETRVADVQALLRRVALKRDVRPGARVVLLVADTHRNRAAISIAKAQLRAEFPCHQRRAVSALAAGTDPGADTLVVLAPGRRRVPRTGPPNGLP